ncbi:S1C family serine protease [Microbacterium sp. A204]|uniref:S1C family serine protease n=1 Tax=Microbacterium sp. A204 TaxID=3457321 RepID=UPI003FD32FEC
MNQSNTPEQPSFPEQPASQTPAGTGAGHHDMPAAFTSHATPQHPVQGAAFGLPQTADPHAQTIPLPPYDNQYESAEYPTQGPMTATKTKEKKPFGAGKVAALIVAAALVGGIAGFGGSYLGTTMWAQPVGSTATGPGTITVNNPGSVNETTAVATEVLPSVVTIQVAGAQGSGSGSGVVLSDDGYVLTNTHVVTLGGAEANPTVRVSTSDGHIYDAEIVGTDPIYDLAVIKLEGAKDLTPIEFADSSNLNVGDTAVAVGAPLGLSNSVTTGIVSALNRSIQIASAALPDSAGQDAPDDQGEGDQGGSPFQFDLPGTQQQTPKSSISISVIQTDAAINPGNSGGALVDSEGSLIGINVAIATAGGGQEAGSIGVGFAIPSNIAQRVSQEIIENGAATHGLLGATVQDASSVESADVAGAVIVEATPGGAADAAGLKKGDIVTEFNGLPIAGATDLTAQVRAAAAGSDATITYVRDGKSYETKATLGELNL